MILEISNLENTQVQTGGDMVIVKFFLENMG